MIYKLENKKTIVLLGIGLIVVVAFLWYKQEITNETIPKKASFVKNNIEWSKSYV